MQPFYLKQGSSRRCVPQDFKVQYTAYGSISVMTTQIFVSSHWKGLLAFVVVKAEEFVEHQSLPVNRLTGASVPHESAQRWIPSFRFRFEPTVCNRHGVACQGGHCRGAAGQFGLSSG